MAKVNRKKVKAKHSHARSMILAGATNDAVVESCKKKFGSGIGGTDLAKIRAANGIKTKGNGRKPRASKDLAIIPPSHKRHVPQRLEKDINDLLGLMRLAGISRLQIDDTETPTRIQLRADIEYEVRT